MNALPATPPPGHVRVRIAVAVVDADCWAANGSSYWQETASARFAGERVAATHRVSFITADVPLPDAMAEIVGVVG